MGAFVGRKPELSRLDAFLARVRDAGRDRPGIAVLMRGRRRVGKSRLVEEFVGRAGVPSVFFTASTRSTAEELRLFADEVAGSSLPGADLFADVQLSTWDAALRLLAAALPETTPSIVVIDEMPYLTRSDPGFEGTLQKAFDRALSRRPVLLVAIGSDVAVMESLNEYGRPFHQRASEMVVPPLSPVEVGDMLGLGPADAFDAYLVTGGLPLICEEWPVAMPLFDYLGRATSDPTSALLVSGERALAAEFPTEVQARSVLGAIGAGERTFTTIGRAAGGLPQMSLSRSLNALRAHRVIAAEQPLSVPASKETRYRVADSYLRFWLAFLGPALPEIERGAGHRVLRRLEASWTSWRGRAIEPVVREALERLPEDARPGGADVFGGYWTRTNDVEIDIVGADRAPAARKILAVGSVKWLENKPFDHRDLGALVAHRDRLPGADADTALVAVSRSGCSVEGVVHLGPTDLIQAWG